MEDIKQRGATRLMTQYTKNMIIGFSIPAFLVIGYKTYKHITTKQLYECIYYTMPENPSLWIDVNVATTEELASLPSVSKSMAKRIVSYRDWIGGFHSIYQLKEVGWWNPYDLSFATKVLYIDSNFQPRKINLYYKNLVKHPYFTPRMAWITVKLKLEGRLSQWEQIVVDSLKLCNKDLATKLKPYILKAIPSHRAKWHDKEQ